MVMQLDTKLIDLGRYYSLEEFLELEDLPETDEEGDPVDYELIRGKLVAKKSGPGGEHGEIVARVAAYLNLSAGMLAGEKQVGRVFSGGSCNLGQDSNVIPDVCFVLKTRLPDPFKGPIPVAPDLVVEINSPTDTTERIQEKIELYQSVKVGLIWSIYLRGKYVLVYKKDNPEPTLVTFSGELSGEDIVPGYKLPVKKLFED